MTRRITRKSFLQMLGACLPTVARGSFSGGSLEGSKTYELKNRFFRLQLRVSADGIWLDQLSLNQEQSRPGAGFTAGLLLPEPESVLLRRGAATLPEEINWQMNHAKSPALFRSCTAILPEQMDWQMSRVKSPAEVSVGGSEESGRWLRVGNVWLGPEKDPLAREEWLLELQGNQLRWRIDRTFLRNCKIAADRFPALVVRTLIKEQGTGETSRTLYSEIPGFLDPEMQLEGTGGFALEVPKGQWYEAISPNRSQEILLAPSGLLLTSRLESGFFSYAKTTSDGTVPAISLGAETVDRRRGIEGRRAGASQRQAWTLQIQKSSGAIPFQLALPDQFLAEQARSFAAVNNQWMGWTFGNNPASIICLHEMGWFPMILGTYAQNTKGQQALERLLMFLAETGVQENGYVFPRWTISGYYRVRWGNLHDQVPHLILAMYFHAVNTGNRDFLRRVMPVLDKVAQYMIALDTDHDGVAEIPETSGLPDGGRHCSNWFDTIEFGHKDAYIQAYNCIALGAMAEMKAFVGDGEAAEHYRAAHRRAVEGFNQVFWDDSKGFYMDWIDVREKMPESGRRYFYTDHNFLAIIFRLADAGKATRILQNLDEHYERLCHDFHLPREAIYATPCNMIPVTQLGDLLGSGAVQNQKAFPNYENGGSWFHTTGLEIAARAIAGQPEKAYETFERVMRYGYARNRLWGALLKWDTGELFAEPLNDALLILWGFLRGCFGVWPTLEKLNIEGLPSRQLEGALHTFCHLGRNVTVTVSDGKARVDSNPSSS